LANLTLYLARHGESTANAEGIFASHRIDAPLSNNGLRQARELARWLKGTPISAVYVSPLLRARQTAEIACAHFDMESVFTDSLAEVDIGDLEGKSEIDPGLRSTYDRVLSLWEQGFHDEGFNGGETLLDAKERLTCLLKRIEDGGPDHVLLVGHCLLFMALIWLFCEDHGPMLEDGHMGRGHLTILRKTGNSFRLQAFDLAPETHIPGT
jgi:broad specificity phosphatase PhoE